MGNVFSTCTTEKIYSTRIIDAFKKRGGRQTVSKSVLIGFNGPSLFCVTANDFFMSCLLSCVERCSTPFLIWLLSQTVERIDANQTVNTCVIAEQKKKKKSQWVFLLRAWKTVSHHKSQAASMQNLDGTWLKRKVPKPKQIGIKK